MLDTKQQEVLYMALDDTIEIMLVDGKAGTGKSHTAKMVAETLFANGWLVSRVSPTGKAAVRIGGITIHSWLEPEVVEDEWFNMKILGYNKQSFSNKECLIVDESSMIDQALWNEIMRVWDNTPSHYTRKIIFIGDSGQLEPVGDGRPFIEILESDGYHRVTLDTIHRQADGNDIVIFANAIRDKQIAQPEYNNVKLATRDDAIRAVSGDPVENQIICPMKKNENGTNALNLEIQRIIGNKQKALDTIMFDKDNKRWIKDKSIYIGDKVLVTKNNFSLGVTNGMTGILTHCGMDEVEIWKYGMVVNESVWGIYIKVDYMEEEVFIPESLAKKTLDLAYALTVHKMQGSECKNIYFFITEDQRFMLNDKLNYTASTRARERLYLVGGK